MWALESPCCQTKPCKHCQWVGLCAVSGDAFHVLVVHNPMKSWTALCVAPDRCWINVVLVRVVLVFVLVWSPPSCHLHSLWSLMQLHVHTSSAATPTS